MAKFLILTAVTGNWDDLTDPPTKFDDCDYIAFVDTPANVSVWEQRPAIAFSTIDKFKNRRNAKIYKALATSLFPQYEYIVWQDGNHHLVKHPQLIVDEYGSFDLLCFKHADRNCWYQEAMCVTKWRVELPENTVAQAEFYLRQEFPQESGLYELPTFIRRNTPIVREFEFMWWEQICKFASATKSVFLTFCGV